MKSSFRSTDASRRSKTTRKQRGASGSGSRKLKSSPMLYDSMDDPSVVAWIQSLPVSPARRSRSRGGDSDGLTHDGCGHPLPESFVKYDRATSSWRMSPGSLLRTAISLPDWEIFSQRWPSWGIALHGECCELPTWEPPTAAPESSSWPTPTANDDNKSPEAHLAMKKRMGERDGTFANRTAVTSLQVLVQMWPTARAEDSESTGAHRGNPDTLTSFTDQWATPNTPSGGPNRKSTTTHQGGLDLDGQVELWGTPNAHQRTFEAREVDHGIQLANQAELWATPHGLTHHQEGGGGEFAKMAEHWPTPDLAMTNGIRREDGKRNTGLNTHAEIFSLPDQGIHGGVEFWQRTRLLLQLCRYLKLHLPSPYNKVKFMRKRRLNPDFVDWLMGWPVGWSSVDRGFSAAEMASYLSALRWRMRCLLKDLEY